MRKITGVQIAVFLCLEAIVIALAVVTAMLLDLVMPRTDFRGVILVAVGLVAVFLFGIAAYRLFLRCCPLLPGEIPHGSRQEFVYHVYVLFFLMLFYPVMRTGFLPAPLMRAVYLALGARLGDNTYSMGLILDPIFVEVGKDSVIGEGALLTPHVIEGSRLAHYPIRIGDNVTIGARASVLAGVEIGDRAVVATGSVVTKGTRIAAGEIWGGIPAVRIREAGAATDI